ncbi:hypothetical protein AC579_7369 [Lecanosticta acicola]|uniref:DUF2293 domain-containing protein n=1 Tax=Lecanosticta acicola TaxID=111012 RepID=A0AAI8Z518_9PEZI|nr:hypothetical protein AC579_7369 [Lecanosticta acicola]
MDFARPWLSYRRIEQHNNSSTPPSSTNNNCDTSKPRRQYMDAQPEVQHLSNLSPEAERRRRREWNRGPLQDLFPRIPPNALEVILDKCIDKPFTYNLSESKVWNSRRYTSIVVAHVRHFYSTYDALLRDEMLERYEARRRSSQQVWKVLREWCPWDADNGVLEQCFNATLLPPSERDPTWDPMDIDDDSDGEEAPHRANTSFDEDAMDLD